MANQDLIALAQHARQAARPLARATAQTRTRALQAMAEALHTARNDVLAANAEDMARARAAGLSPVMCERLELNNARIDALIRAIDEIAAQDDPVGQQTRAWTRPNGLQVAKVRLPLGVILMIYESRPNVTLDAAALCIRSGNAVILRGGSEAMATNRVLANVVQQGLRAAGLPKHAAQLVPTQDRSAIDTLLELDTLIDLVIPRGGEALIRHVARHSRIPVVQHYKGVCHLFIERTANPAMALAIAENAKVQRPGVCNALETLLVDQGIAAQFVPQLVAHLQARGVEIRGCERTQRLVPTIKAASDADWDTEFLDLILAVRVVDDLQQAIDHIDQHGTQHTASIVTNDAHAAERFTREVDASCVLVNASTRFNDGGELGLGAEMGISTTRVHAYGPMGAEALCSERFVVLGQGQVR